MRLTEITDYNSKELDIYARTSVAALANLYAPDGGIFIADSFRVKAGVFLTCVRMYRCIQRPWMSSQRLRDLSSQGESCVR